MSKFLNAKRAEELASSCESQDNILFIIDEVDFIDNFGITMLSAVARSIGWNTLLTVFNKKSIDDVFRKFKPRIVCYSSMSSNSDTYLMINRYLKTKYEFVSIMGGPHPTYFPEVIQEEGLDYICRGEGELAFAEFLTKYKNRESVESVGNFWSKTNRNPVRELVQDLDTLPFPDRELFFENTSLKKMPIKTFMTSRGCPFPCTYCYNLILKTEYKGKGRYERTHSVDRVVEEINRIRSKYPLDLIKFEDDFFGINKTWLEEFSKTYRKEIGLPFNCLQRIDLIDKDRIKLLKEANCFSINVAIDSANERIRNEILNRKMKIPNKEIVSRILMVKEGGINVHTNFIIGIPTSNIEDEIDGINLNIECKTDYANSTILVPYPKTAMWDYCIKNNINFGNCDGKSLFVSIQKKSVLSCFTDKEKDIQWNLSAFFPAIVKFPGLKSVFIWIAKHTKPNIAFAGFYVLCRAYLLSKYIYPTKMSLLYRLENLFKALKIEVSRMLGFKKQ